MVDPALLISAAVGLALVVAVQRREFFRLRWRPTRHLGVALGVGLLAAAISALALVFPEGSFARGFTIWVGIFGLCGFALPWGYVLLVERGSPASLAITRDRWAASLVVSALFAGGSVVGLLEKADLSRYEPSHLIGTAFALNVGGLFELFLYCGFIHLRLRDACGPLPAILGTAAIYSIWHLGTELPMHDDPLDALAMLFVVGVLSQSIFAVTYNALAVWPLFFTAGVMHDFVVNLDLPEEIGTSLAWPLVGWALAITVPWAIWRYSCASGASTRSGSGSSSN